MRQITSEFPELVQKVLVGTTFQENDMPGYIIAVGMDENLLPHDQESIINRPAILITGMHHGDHLTTLS